MTAAAPSPAPDPLPRSRERLAVAALALAAFALNLNTNVLGALLPFLRTEGLLDGGESMLIAAAAIGSAVGALLAAPVAARHGRRGALAGSLAGFVLASALHLFAASFWPLLALRLASGLLVGVAYANASALVAELAPYGRRGAAMSVFTAGMFLAIPIGMPLAVALAQLGSWPAIFGVQAAVGALGWWWALRAVPRGPAVERRGLGLAVLAERGVAAALLATMLHVGSFFVTVQLATLWLHDTGLVPRDDQMWLWIGFGLASVAGSAMLGRVADQLGKRNFVLITSIVLVGCFALIARGPAPALLLGLAVLLVVTAAARTGPLQALVSSLVPADRFAAVMGLRGCAMQAGVAAFAFASAPVVADLGFGGVTMLAAGCQFLSYVAIRFGVRRGA